MILDRVNSPIDIKSMSVIELKTLASEIRELIIKKVNITGGHMAPNLGVVEATIAMHYVFNSPLDKIIFDVAHQCYTHKILTGRKDGFTNPENYYKYTGFTAPSESEHDIFQIGHTSTSVSLACGVAKARDLKKDKSNVIAFIGDGSLSGGEALEGLDNAATFDTNLIIVVNDNQMSIAENHGGLYTNLKLLRETNGENELNFFKAMGFDYKYCAEGNDIKKLIELFSSVKDINHPIVVHICTKKGCGLKQAEENKEIFHWMLPGLLDQKDPVHMPETYTSITTDYIVNKAKEDKDFIVVNAGTPGVFGFNSKIRDELGKQYTDVGIAEEHAIAYCSAIAKSGVKPIFTVMSSFVQRTYDQMLQDWCLNKSPMTMLVYWGGISGADATHLCTFDMPLISNIPNMVYLAPTSKEEHLSMLKWSVEQQTYPVAIRVPNIPLKSSNYKVDTDYSQINKFKVTQQGEKVAILGLGNFFDLACKVADKLENELGFKPTVINPRYITGVDTELMEDLKTNHSLVITLEDGLLNGGFGEKIARFYGDSEIKVICRGAEKEFTDIVPYSELIKRYRLTETQLLEDIKSALC